MVDAQIQPENLKLFLETLSDFTGYAFDPDWDWDAVRFGVEDTNVQHNAWFAYDLSANKSLKLLLAADSSAVLIRIRAEADQVIEARIVPMADLMRRYRLEGGAPAIETMIEGEFSGYSYPSGDIVGPGDWPEHQDCRAYFQGKHWRDLVDAPKEMQCGYGGLTFLRPPAWRFFLPAYMVAALRYRDERILESVLSQLEGNYRASDEHQERLGGFTPTQRAVIDLFLKFVKTDKVRR